VASVTSRLQLGLLLRNGTLRSRGVERTIGWVELPARERYRRLSW